METLPTEASVPESLRRRAVRGAAMRRPPKMPRRSANTGPTMGPPTGPTMGPAPFHETAATGLAAVGQVFAQKGQAGVDALVSADKQFRTKMRYKRAFLRAKKDPIKSAAVLQGLVQSEYDKRTKK